MYGPAFFSSLDVSQAFRHIPVHPDSIPKTSFVTERGQWEFLRCPFGIKSIPSLWSRLADLVFKGLKWQIMNLYMDDLLVYSRDFETHVRDVETVLQRAASANLVINISKCSWCQEELDFLGFVVGRNGVKPNPAKIKAMTDFPCPKDVSSLRSFLSLASYYRRFVRSFSSVAAPLNALLCKGVPWMWGDEQQYAFDTLKKALASQTVLAYPDFSSLSSLWMPAPTVLVPYYRSMMPQGMNE